MLCDKCNKNKATIHIVRVVNGVKQEMNLCDTCAKQQDDIGFYGMGDVKAPLYFQNLLSGLMDYMKPSKESIAVEGQVCEHCGMTYEEFKEKSLLGCEKCYETFAPMVNPIIKRVQRSNEHIGKVPHNGGKELIEKRTLLKLKEELQKAILEEEYEEAAVIRDKIKELQEKNGEGDK